MLRKNFLRGVVLVALCVTAASGPRAQARRPTTLVDLMNIPRIDDAQITRDGERIAFQMRTTDWPAKVRIPQVWQVKSDGTMLRRMTSMESGAAIPRWSPDGSTLAFFA